MGAMRIDNIAKIAHQPCAKYSTLYKIAHVSCAKTGDMEIAYVNVLEIAHLFSLCSYCYTYTGKNGTFRCAISMSPVLARFTCAILYSMLYLAHA